jgi:site-specific DNA-methyltransferase (adenine-specific)
MKKQTQSNPSNSNPIKAKLYHGDCLTIMSHLPPQSVDLILADLPYGVTRQSWDQIIPLDELWAAYMRVCKPEANIVLLATNPFAAKLIMSRRDWYRYDLVWVKNKSTGFLNANRMPLRRHEYILVFRAHGIGTYNAQKSTGHPPVNAVSPRKQPVRAAVYGALRKRTASGGATERHPTSVLPFDVVNNDSVERIHRNQKPVSLMNFLVRSFSNPADLVLDNCMGSGTTGVACIQSGRSFIGIEKSPACFRRAVRRIDSCRPGEAPAGGQITS